MVRISIDYTGEKHCELTHGPSGSKIGTDAPKDNNGKGELFSPTDLLAAATGSCMLTVMGIAAEKAGLDMNGARSTVDKEMGTTPRRVVKLTVEIHMPKKLSAQDRILLEEAAMGCPVKKSLHPEMQIPVTFVYDI
jgi:uncharacterized OsmC-like protein